MMQCCASAAKLRGGGPILRNGLLSHGPHGTPPPRNVIGDPSQALRTGPKLSKDLGAAPPVSVCWTQDDALGHHAIANLVPERDEQLARQGHDHLLARGAGVLGASFKPLCQGAVLLIHEKAPRQQHHAAPDPSVTRL